MLSDCQGLKAVSWIRPKPVITSAEFQNLPSFSWNCEAIVDSARSHSATRPSYFGPNSPKLSSSGLAAWAAELETSRASAAVIGPSDRKDVNRLRMGNPPVSQRPRRCREALTRSSAARQHLTAKSASCCNHSFHGDRRTLWWASSETE